MGAEEKVKDGSGESGTEGITRDAKESGGAGPWSAGIVSELIEETVDIASCCHSTSTSLRIRSREGSASASSPCSGSVVCADSSGFLLGLAA